VKPEQGIKPAGPQLVWLSGDRLEVTMFLWKPSPGTPVYSPGWQKVVDIRTGTVDNVPAAQVPSTPNTTTEPTLSPNGARVSYTLNAGSGQRSGEGDLDRQQRYPDVAVRARSRRGPLPVRPGVLGA